MTWFGWLSSNETSKEEVNDVDERRCVGQNVEVSILVKIHIYT